MKRILLAAALSTGVVASTHAGVITTLAAENSTIVLWGLPDTSAYGQTFNLASAANLNSVLFRIDDFGVATTFDLNIFAWDGSKASGASLASVSGSTAGVAGMADVFSSVGALALAAGDYVAFLQATSPGSAAWGSVDGSDAYAGGEFVFQNNGGNPAQWTTTNWESDWQGPDHDLAFEMVFDEDNNQVPVAPTLPLLVTGFALMFGARRWIAR